MSALSYRRRRRKKGGMPQEVELNLAAMLDMAFQLLAFFILTFRPSPVEGQISLRLPPPQGLMGGTTQAGEDTSSEEIPKGLNTFVLSIFARPDGSLDNMMVGQDTPVPNLTKLNRELSLVFADESTPFDQILLQVSSDLRYEELMKVIDVCTRQTIFDPEMGRRVPLSKLSFVEMSQESN